MWTMDLFGGEVTVQRGGEGRGCWGDLCTEVAGRLHVVACDKSRATLTMQLA